MDNDDVDRMFEQVKLKTLSLLEFAKNLEHPNRDLGYRAACLLRMNSNLISERPNDVKAIVPLLISAVVKFSNEQEFPASGTCLESMGVLRDITRESPILLKDDIPTLIQYISNPNEPHSISRSCYVILCDIGTSNKEILVEFQDKLLAKGLKIDEINNETLEKSIGDTVKEGIVWTYGNTPRCPDCGTMHVCWVHRYKYKNWVDGVKEGNAKFLDTKKENNRL